MRSFLKRLPVPIGCVALGFAGLGTLLAPYHPCFLIIFLALSMLIQAFVLFKLLAFGGVLSPYADDISLSTLSGTSMAMMLSSAALHTVFRWEWPVWQWAAGLALHCLIILFFSVKLVRERNSGLCVRGSWLLVYVGIAAAAISGPSFSFGCFVRLILIPSGCAVVVLLPLVYMHDSRLPEAQKPLFCITAAPVSIWLSGCLCSVPSMEGRTILLLLILSQLFYVPAFLRFIRCREQRFTPAFAAFTFPFVICASTLGQSAEALSAAGWLRPLFYFEVAAALILCCFATLKYARFLFSVQKDPSS